MALAKKEMAEIYPLPSYSFNVEVEGATIGFKDVTGLTITYNTVTYKESPTGDGAAGPRVMHMPGQRSPSTVTLSKGVMRSGSVAVFFDWMRGIQNNLVEKKDITIRLIDEEGKPVISWLLRNAFPTTYTAPTFDADSDAVAMESMQLTCDVVFVEEA